MHVESLQDCSDQQFDSGLIKFNRGVANEQEMNYQRRRENDLLSAA